MVRVGRAFLILSCLGAGDLTMLLEGVGQLVAGNNIANMRDSETNCVSKSTPTRRAIV